MSAFAVLLLSCNKIEQGVAPSEPAEPAPEEVQSTAKTVESLLLGTLTDIPDASRVSQAVSNTFSSKWTASLVSQLALNVPTTRDSILVCDLTGLSGNFVGNAPGNLWLVEDYDGLRFTLASPDGSPCYVDAQFSGQPDTLGTVLPVRLIVPEAADLKLFEADSLLLKCHLDFATGMFEILNGDTPVLGASLRRYSVGGSTFASVTIGGRVRMDFELGSLTAMMLEYARINASRYSTLQDLVRQCDSFNSRYLVNVFLDDALVAHLELEPFDTQNGPVADIMLNYLADGTSYAFHIPTLGDLLTMIGDYAAIFDKFAPTLESLLAALSQ